jgi:hypothetical protein
MITKIAADADRRYGKSLQPTEMFLWNVTVETPAVALRSFPSGRSNERHRGPLPPLKNNPSRPSVLPGFESKMTTSATIYLCRLFVMVSFKKHP